MQKDLLLRVVLTFLVDVGLTTAASADVKLPAVFGDHMALQCDVPVPLWGWANPGEKVTVSTSGQTKTATADSTGKWSVKLDALKAGGPIEVTIQGNNTIRLSNVLVGEVWLCSGQSNMAMTVGASANAKEEIAAADYPQIRLFTVARKTAEKPQQDCAGQWKVCEPKTVGGFSAAGYFFGRELHKQLNVPVGLIDSSWGGTPVQGWTCFKAQEAVPELKPLVESFKKVLASYSPEKAKQQYERQMAKWKEDVGRRLAQWALAKTYGKDVVACGPLYKSMKHVDGKIVIDFDYTAGKLVAKGDSLKGFAVAGEDKVFVWADAKIEGDKVVVSSPKVKSPVAVRYAWANNPECNLFSQAGLPASPFRTDDWTQ